MVFSLSKACMAFRGVQSSNNIGYINGENVVNAEKIRTH